METYRYYNAFALRWSSTENNSNNAWNYNFNNGNANNNNKDNSYWVRAVRDSSTKHLLAWQANGF